MNFSSRLIAVLFFSIPFSLDAQQLITSYSVDQGLPQSTITSLYRDNDGYLWCGTPVGLSLFDGTQFLSAQNSTEKSAPTLSGPIHGIVASMDKKTIWVGTDSVIVQIDRFSLKPIRSFDVIKTLGTIESPIIANDTAVWLGCSGLGLYRVRISDGKVTALSGSGCKPETQAALYNNTIACFADAARCVVFVSITTGILWTVELPAVLNSDQIRSVAELPDAEKSVLLLTTNGLWRCEYATGVVERYNIDHENYTDSLTEYISMAAHPNGNFWFATASEGIFEYNPRTQKTLSCGEHVGDMPPTWKHGIPSVLICDEYGVAWCGTNGQGLLKMVHGRYVISSGAFERRCFRTPAIVTSYPQDTGEIGGLQELIERNYGSAPLVLHLWQTDLAFPDEAIFSWQLEGPGESRVTTQGVGPLSIEPTGSGFYSFICSVEVPGCEKTATSKLFTVKIVTPFWMSGWFIGLTSMGVVLIITLILFVMMRMNYQRKLRKLKMQQELDKVRQRISQDIHDEIGAGLTRIALSGDLMSLKIAKDDAQYDKLKSIAGTARELSQSMKEVVWSVNPHYDSLDHMAAYFRSYVAGVAENADVRFRYVSDENLPAEEVNPETRRNLLLILKETISNAVKYSGATELSLEVHWASGKLRMVIADNGKGFDLDGPSGVNSNGLRNIRQRAEASGCIVTLRSSSGKGTSVEISGPIAQ